MTFLFRNMIFFILFNMTTGFAALNMKLSHNQSETHSIHQALQYFANRAKEISRGDLRIQIYPNAELGEQHASVQQVQEGTLEFAKSNAAELETQQKEYGVFNYPYLFNTKKHYYQTLNSDIGQNILKSSQDKGFIGLAYFTSGARSFYANKPINLPSDLKGMKVRVQSNAIAMDMVTTLGAIPVPLPYNELYFALKNKTVDAAENNPTALTIGKHGEISRFFSMDEHTMVPDVLIISTKVWNTLSEKNQNAILKAAQEASIKMQELWDDEENIEIAKAKKMGVSFISVNKKPFQDAMKPLFDRLEKIDIDTFKQVEKIRALPH